MKYIYREDNQTQKGFLPEKNQLKHRKAKKIISIFFSEFRQKNSDLQDFDLATLGMGVDVSVTIGLLTPTPVSYRSV